MLEFMKAKSEEERKEFDSNNLTLQSLLYGKHYFSGEVHFCKEFKTPNLQNALPEEEYASRFKNLSPNVPNKAAPRGRTAKPTPKVASARRKPAAGLLPGKNSLPNNGASVP